MGASSVLERNQYEGFASDLEKKLEPGSRVENYSRIEMSIRHFSSVVRVKSEIFSQK